MLAYFGLLWRKVGGKAYFFLGLQKLCTYDIIRLLDGLIVGRAEKDAGISGKPQHSMRFVQGLWHDHNEKNIKEEI